MALYAFDGTWNEEHDAGEYGRNTNVVKFVAAYQGNTRCYTKGIGTRHGFIGKLIGGAFGVGGRSRIAEAQKRLQECFLAGDETVDIVGFSRGAALAIHFANVIGRMQVRTQSGEKVRPRVRFLGLWDLVAAFGIPIDLGPLRFQRINLGYKLTLPDHVDYCFHAVALDERRKAFRYTRVENAYQVWFRGAHSDVGGGNENPLLSNISLAWMLRKARRVGLPIDPGAADALQIDGTVPIKHAKLGVRGRFRAVQPGDLVHYTVDVRQTGECQVPPEGCGRETIDDERNRITLSGEIAEEPRKAA